MRELRSNVLRCQSSYNLAWNIVHVGFTYLSFGPVFESADGRVLCRDAGCQKQSQSAWAAARLQRALLLARCVRMAARADSGSWRAMASRMASCSALASIR